MELIKTSALASLALKYLALATLLLGATAHTAAQPLVDENGHQLYTIYLDEHLVEQVDASDQEPMRPASDPRNAEDWRGWHRATTRAVVALIEEEYGIEAVGMTSHIIMTFSAYLNPEIAAALITDVYVTEIVPVTEVDIDFAGPGKPSVVPIPTVPKAYEPFALEIVTRREDAGTLIAVNVVGNVITIEHQTDAAADFIPPGGLMVVNFSGLPAGEYTVQNKEFASGGYGPGGYLYPDLPATISIAEAPPIQQVYALYLPDTKHYFITASDVEKELIKDFTIPVDVGFNAWAANGPAPASALPVCRFYSYLVNSHFYTASEEECELVKSEDSGWVYEGIAFQALVPLAGGACPPGTDPVWRLYNNRHAQQDSNHRFVASMGIYHAMVADGWIGEGVAFCSPPTSE